MNSFKKYLVGFIVGILSVGTITYAADTGTIGSLFSSNSNYSSFGSVWKNFSIMGIKTNTIQLGDYWVITTDIDSLNFTNTNTSKTITFGTDGNIKTSGNISAIEYNYN